MGAKMKCPDCHTENTETRKFCRECGNKLLLICPGCSFNNLPGDKFCGECGYNLKPAQKISKIVANYDGFIEKYAGDAVMAIFGVHQKLG
jgi:hypothetical protein